MSNAESCVSGFVLMCAVGCTNSTVMSEASHGDIMAIAPGTEGRLVIETFGAPDFWGNLDDRESESKSHSIDMTWMFTGQSGPLGIPGQISWVYVRGRNEFLEPVEIVLLTDDKVDRVIRGTFHTIYDP